MNIYLSLLVAIIGALVYAVSVNAKAQELGRCAYWCGLVVFLYYFAAGRGLLK